MSRIEPREFILKDGRKAIIREAEKRDAQNYLKLLDTVIKEDEYNTATVSDIEKFNLNIEKEQKYIENHNKDGSVLLLAEIDSKIIGMIGIENGSRQKMAHVGTLNIRVDSRYRRKGVATSLLKAVTDWAVKDPLIKKIGLEVFANHTGAINLYKNSGFIEEGRKVKEIKIAPGTYIDSILMYKFV